MEVQQAAGSSLARHPTSTPAYSIAGVIGVLVMSAEGVVLRTTLQAEVAVQASALTQGVIKVARTAVRELGLVNFGAPPEDEFAPPSRKEPGQSVLQHAHNMTLSGGRHSTV